MRECLDVERIDGRRKVRVRRSSGRRDRSDPWTNAAGGGPSTKIGKKRTGPLLGHLRRRQALCPGIRHIARVLLGLAFSDLLRSMVTKDK